ncbi:hypothetical protein GCM10010300_66690 [Streptomyces olivaceoviridis]|nr:hypothetical protein GCM10010300_66690 [Streptomyces olivaceoviridis]
METSFVALPRPFTLASCFWASARARSVSADTDASNSDARAEADEAAAEAEALASAFFDSAQDDMPDGTVPEKFDVAGAVGVEVPTPPLLLPLPHEATASTPVSAAPTPYTTGLRRERAVRDDAASWPVTLDSDTATSTVMRARVRRSWYRPEIWSYKVG